MERNLFFDVFEGLKVDEDLYEKFKKTKVTKIAKNKAGTALKISIENDRIIDKADTEKMKKKLSAYFGVKKSFKIIFSEKYHLSSLYTRENLMEAYKDSIIMELENKDPFVAVVFKKSTLEFEEDRLTVYTDTNFISDSKTDILKNTIEDIYRERFDMTLNVSIRKKQSRSGEFEKINRIKLKNELDAISIKRNAAFGEDETTESSGKKTVSSDREKSSSILYGRRQREFTEIKMEDASEGLDGAALTGQIMSMEDNETKNHKFIVSIAFTDFSDSIKTKLFLNSESDLLALKSRIFKGSWIRVIGTVEYDTFEREITLGHVRCVELMPKRPKNTRIDTAARKRVELHCHTKMSDMDGVSDCRAIVRRAYEWGHRAIAITDHGVVQAFPDAWHEYCDIRNQCEKSGKELDFKVIYGVEAYLVDDLKDIIKNSKGQSFDDTYVAFDLETTGLSPVSDKIIEIGAVKIHDEEITDRFSCFVNPNRPIPYNIEKLTGISDDMVKDAKTIEEVLPEFMEFCKGSVMVAHNAEFDMSFIEKNCEDVGITCDFTVVDTVPMSQMLVTSISKFKLDKVAKALNIVLENHHRAVDDAECCALIFIRLIKMLASMDIRNLDELNRAGMESPNIKKRLYPYHAVILIKNLTGRVNLYKLISKSHIETFSNKKPRIMKSDFIAHRDGLIIGTACEAGELYQALLHGKDHETIARIADFYDYFEVQPVSNNEFMVKTGDPEIDGRKKFLVESREYLENINKEIIDLGIKFGKLTVATCDVHFLDPEDEIYRRIIQFGNGYRDADNQPPLYLRTTDEMLEEFGYLGSDLAREIVIDNPNKICDMIDNISPIYPEKCPPVLENSEENLKKLCYGRAKELYGENLPEIVAERLETELDSIIGNGYAVMYIMAQRLVWKSNEDGYLVGSRGSVGSSLAATMSGITECNPLPPHYYCTECKSSFFEDEYVVYRGADKEAVTELQNTIKKEREDGGVGFDLPDRVCPCCGSNLSKDGLEIPFETFLGFGGTKEPDIDLNFSGEYQSRAHDYTEEMFGKGHTFRAGTITGLADKTAYGYVKNYFLDHGITKRNVEIERIAKGCEGIRKSTGQHPGGIVIVPRDKEIYDFTPIQKPANDMSEDTITTHFEYHAIDSNLLKLDILGHDDPTMIKKLENLTGTNVKTDVPFKDEKVMSLFLGPEALGITSEDIDGCPTGSLGLPELGTDFVIQMLVDTRPKKIADLIRLAGLSHGTDVWLGNAQELIKDGKCTISEAICTRDDIMVYLIDKGIEPQISFQIMEHVRKGKGLLVYNEKKTGREIDEEGIMREHNVPDWYIGSCKKIRYMFPKAHAAAYIMMALRVAWYKVYEPLAYYAAYFGIRAKAFDYEKMCRGRERLEFFMSEIKSRIENNTATKKDQDTLSDMKIVQEMYARGFEFIPLDIYKAKARDFLIIDGKIMPALNSVNGMGDKAAEALERSAKEAAESNGKFTSKNEMKDKTGITKTVIETMTELGLLDGMPEDSQLSIFDF